MVSDLEHLAQMEYPGRFIILGKRLDGYNLAVYGITGRSQSSQARKMVINGDNTIQVIPTDFEIIKTGNPELLIYSAICCSERGIAVSNGKQTADIFKQLNEQLKPELNKQEQNPVDILINSLESKWSYEPDHPNYTPRISGVINFAGLGLSIIKKNSALQKDNVHNNNNNNAKSSYYNLALNKGEGKLIATYNGKNINPLPSFEREPSDLKLIGRNNKEIAEMIWGNLRSEYRVSVACVLFNDHKEHNRKEHNREEPYIINKNN